MLYVRDCSTMCYMTCVIVALCVIFMCMIVALCGGVLQLQSNTTGSQQGVVSSPNFPSAPSGTPVNCRWVIGAPSGEQVRLTITDIGITGDCNQNYIQFRDQPYITQVRTISCHTNKAPFLQ